MKEEIEEIDDELKKFENDKYGENTLLDTKVLNLIQKHHQEHIIRVEWNTRKFGIECDCFIKIGKTVNRTIGIELKEVDLQKVVEQAIKRREMFNYFYIITNSSAYYLHSSLMFMMRHKLLKKLYDNWIGWIVYDKIDEPILLLETRLKLIGLQRVVDLK